MDVLREAAEYSLYQECGFLVVISACSLGLHIGQSAGGQLATPREPLSRLTTSSPPSSLTSLVDFDPALLEPDPTLVAFDRSRVEFDPARLEFDPALAEFDHGLVEFDLDEVFDHGLVEFDPDEVFDHGLVEFDLDEVAHADLRGVVHDEPADHTLSQYAHLSAHA
eukprot:826207-Rhodomonas_salina.2